MVSETIKGIIQRDNSGVASEAIGTDHGFLQVAGDRWRTYSATLETVVWSSPVFTDITEK